jgi:hypothetical protein
MLILFYLYLIFIDSSYACARLVVVTFIAFLFSAVAGIPRDQPSVQVSFASILGLFCL